MAARTLRREHERIKNTSLVLQFFKLNVKGEADQASPLSDHAIAMRSLVHLLEVEFSAFFQARWPARCDGFGACVELERVGAVLVQVAKT